MASTLMRWDPFGELSDLRSRFDRIFGEMPERPWVPAVDVTRDGEGIIVRADVPGIKPEEVKIEVEGDLLTISGEHEERKEEKDEHYMRRERRYGSFSRSMALPAGVDARQIKATTHDGVVEVTIPLPVAVGAEKVTITPTRG
jgi:HSP20 family protein